MKYMGQKRYHYREIDSTNQEAARLADVGCPHGTVVIANKQTAGRGRRGRQWCSDSDTGLWCSIVLKPEIPIEAVSPLTLVAALAVKSAIEKVADIFPKIKWPNDLVLSGKKVCGILTEMKLEQGKMAYVVVGIGINVKQQKFPEELSGIATCLEQEGKTESVRNLSISELLEAVLEYFEYDYEQYTKTMDLTLLLSEYEESLVNKGEQVKVLDPLGYYTGIARGINEKGELLVECQGELRKVNSGEVSVRGIYGYV